MAHLEQVQTQTQVLAPQLRQSLKVLQASALELRAMVQEEIATNPMLEEIPNEENKSNGKEKENVERDTYTNFSNSSSSEANKHHAFLMDSITNETSLQEHLQEQVGCMELPKKLREIVDFIIGSLNEKGFLELSTEDLMQQTASNHTQVMRACSLVQSLDPVGVGCKDVLSSLKVQLIHQHKADSLAFKILSNHYDSLLRNKLADIARACSVSVGEVQAAIRNDISTLQPNPGSAYVSHKTHAMIPDVRIYKNDLQQWIVEVNRPYLPQLRLGNQYKTLLAKNLTKEDRSYLRIKMRSGRFLIQAILQRQKTVEQIARALLHRQYDFFEKGIGHLKPLTLQSIAEDLGVHETTVSRATANKYIDTPFGVFTFKYFFTKGLPGENGTTISNNTLKQQLQKIVSEEDKHHPYSDQQLAALLAKNYQAKIARRTVTKYREVLGILAANLRRQYD